MKSLAKQQSRSPVRATVAVAASCVMLLLAGGPTALAQSAAVDAGAPQSLDAGGASPDAGVEKTAPSTASPEEPPPLAPSLPPWPPRSPEPATTTRTSPGAPPPREPTPSAPGRTPSSATGAAPARNAHRTTVAGSSDTDAPMEELDLADLLENVVVTATKTELKEDQAPAITTVVSREEIRRWGYQSTAEVLEHVAGVYVIDDHIIPNLGIRGISGGLRSESGLVKVMIDGHSVAFRSTAGNWLGPELIPLAVIQQIEIIRGPASALYGADAFLGVINVVTRRPEQMEGGEITPSVGGTASAPRWGQDVGVGATAGRWKFLLSYRHVSEDRSGLHLPDSSPAPRLPLSAPADRLANGMVLDSNVSFATLSYRLGPTATATLTGYVSRIDRQAEFADWAQLTHNIDAQGRANGTDVSLQQGFANLELAWRPVSSVDVTVNGTAFTGGPTNRDRIEAGNDIYYIKRSFGYRGLEAQTEVSWRPVRRVTTLFGAGVVVDREDFPAVYHVLKADFGDLHAGEQRLASTAVGGATLWNPGAHGLVYWTPVPVVSLIGGVRYDYHNIYGGQPSARAGGVLSLGPTLHFKLLYGSAFKAPSPQLLWGSPLTVGDIAGNRQLKPSYVHTIEGQLSYRPRSYLLFTTGLAYNYLQNQAAFALVGVNQVAQNVAQVESISWESEFKLEWRRRLAGYANLSLVRTRRHLDDTGYVAALTDYPNPGYPTAVVRAGSNAAVPHLPLRIGVEGSFVSARPSSAANTLSAGGRYFLDSYFLLGANIRTSGIELLPQRETTFSFSVRNVLDTKIVDPGYSGADYPRLGRVMLLELTQQL